MMRIVARIVAGIVVMLAVAAPGGDLWFAQVQASQGPGVGPGHASAMLQHVMALLVYGIAGVLVVAGLIGAARRRGVR